MKARGQFPAGVLTEIRKRSILHIRAGTEPHRFIGIWAVVVDDRVFVRSWSVRAGGWYRTFLQDPRGAIYVAGDEISVRGLPTRGRRLNDAIDRAYVEKYVAPVPKKYERGPYDYTRDPERVKRRGATLELVPM